MGTIKEFGLGVINLFSIAVSLKSPGLYSTPLYFKHIYYMYIYYISSIEYILYWLMIYGNLIYLSDDLNLSVRLYLYLRYVYTMQWNIEH